MHGSNLFERGPFLAVGASCSILEMLDNADHMKTVAAGQRGYFLRELLKANGARWYLVKGLAKKIFFFVCDHE